MNSKGKIYWIEDDFKYIGNRPLTDIANGVGRCETFVADENMIRMVLQPTNYYEDQSSTIMINLIKENENFYKGKATAIENDDFEAIVDAKVFTNSLAYLLFGTWTEGNIDGDDFVFYTWIAEIMK